MSKFTPNFSQVPNAFIDEIMVKLPDSSVKMYLLIVRKTKGWSKEVDSISISQFMKFTGKSRPTVVESIKYLVEAGIVLEHEATRYGKTYSINDEIYDGFFLLLPSKKILLVKIFNYSSKKTLLPLVKIFNTQKKLSKETNQKKKGAPKKQVGFSEDFEKFWEAYPRCKRKSDKSGTFKTFEKYKSVVTTEALIKILNAQKQDQSWIKQDGEFIPAPTAWLNQKNWENDYWTTQAPVFSQATPAPQNLKTVKGAW